MLRNEDMQSPQTGLQPARGGLPSKWSWDKWNAPFHQGVSHGEGAASEMQARFRVPLSRYPLLHRFQTWIGPRLLVRSGIITKLAFLKVTMEENENQKKETERERERGESRRYTVEIGNDDTKLITMKGYLNTVRLVGLINDVWWGRSEYSRPVNSLSLSRSLPLPLRAWETLRDSEATLVYVTRDVREAGIARVPNRISSKFHDVTSLTWKLDAQLWSSLEISFWFTQDSQASCDLAFSTLSSFSFTFHAKNVEEQRNTEKYFKEKFRTKSLRRDVRELLHTRGNSMGQLVWLGNTCNIYKAIVIRCGKGGASVELDGTYVIKWQAEQMESEPAILRCKLLMYWNLLNVTYRWSNNIVSIKPYTVAVEFCQLFIDSPRVHPRTETSFSEENGFLRSTRSTHESNFLWNSTEV